MSDSLTGRRRETLNALIKVSQPEGFTPALQRVREIAEHENSDATKLAEALSLDPGLTTRILSMANSSFYTTRRKQITDLNEAVVTLGFEAVRRLTLTSGVTKMLSEGEESEGSHTPFPTDRFWTHSISCGLAMPIMASRLKLSDSNDTFVTGFLHDIAKLVLKRYLPEKWENVLTAIRSGVDPLQAESDTFGLNHAEVGAWLLRKWRFPTDHYVAVGIHHQEESKMQNKLGQALYQADLIAIAVMDTYPIYRRNRQMVELKLMKSQVPIDVLHNIIDEIIKQVKGIAGNLELPIVDIIADESKMHIEKPDTKE